MTEEEVIQQLAKVSGVTYSNEQLKILHHHGGMCIVACAGSGKTTVIVDLIAKRRLTGEIPNFDKLLCTTYSKAGSLEMEERLNKKLTMLGINERVKVKTLHASYYTVLRHFGMNFNICSNGQRAMFVSQACKDAKVQLGDDDLQLIDSLLSFQVNNLLDDVSLTKSYVYTLENVTLEQYSKIRAGYNQRKQDAGVIDFDDMQLYMYMLLVQQNRQDILTFCHSKWEYFFVDEFQDVSKIQFAILRKLVTDPNKLVVIGDDDQSLVERSKVVTDSGIVNIEDVDVGDRVLCGNGWGDTDYFTVRAKEKKKHTDKVIKITTKSGKVITGTPGHIGFAGTATTDLVYNYLMYRHGYGYRVGTVRGTRSNNFGEDNIGIDQRIMQEHSDKAWIINVENTFREALKSEQEISARYGIPTCRFEADYAPGKSKEQIDREHIERKQLFEDMDTYSLVGDLFDEMGINPEYPHYITQADGDRFRIKYTLMGHNTKYKSGTRPSIVDARTSNEWYEQVLNENMQTCIKTAKSGYRYTEARAFGVDDDRLGGILKNVRAEADLAKEYLETILEAKLTKTTHKFMPFSNMFPGMVIPVLKDGTLVDEEIVSISTEDYDGYVYDLDVPGVRNFICDGVAVHNCIYQWRGADPSIILNICGYYDIQKFVLSTNYRCAGNIVNRAAVGIKNNARRYDKDMIPFNQGGDIKVYDTKSCNLYKASLPAYAYIKHMIEEEHISPQDIAVLARNNNHLSILSNLLFKDGIFTSTAPDMRISSMPLYKDVKNLMAFAENTYNKNLVDSILWRVCGYLGIKNSKIFSRLMDNTGCSIKDALGYCLSHFAPGQRIEWKGKLNMTAKAESKVQYEFSAISTNAEYNLCQIYKAFEIESMVERISAMLSLYAVSMSFMYKSSDRARTLSGLVEYIKKLIETDGIQETQSFMRLTEQFDSGSMVVTEPMITMSTMHGAKGREWKYVILFADDNLTFPSFEGINKMIEDNIAPVDISGSIDENRRLHYVAMTRAKTRLTIFADVANISVYTLEAFGLLTRKESEYNQHIVDMAVHGIPGELTAKALELFTSENSEFKFDTQISIPNVIQDTGALIGSDNRADDIEGDDSDEEYEDDDYGDPYDEGY